jgi:hypothetical protein
LKQTYPKPPKERDTSRRGGLRVMVTAVKVGEVKEEAIRHI